MSKMKKALNGAHFTFLNACCTYSSDWANTFGIDFTHDQFKDTAQDYLLSGHEPRAFVGWTNYIDLPEARSIPSNSDYKEVLEALFLNWMANRPLIECMIEYENKATEYEFGGASSWAISGCYDLRR